MKKETLTFPVAALPKHAQRRVVWHENDVTYNGTEKVVTPKKPSEVSGHIMVLVGYCPDTLPYFLRMIEEIQKAYPELDLKEVVCGKVTQSNYNKGFTLVIAPIAGPKRDIPGFDVWHSIDFGY